MYMRSVVHYKCTEACIGSILPRTVANVEDAPKQRDSWIQIWS